MTFQVKRFGLSGNDRAIRAETAPANRLDGLVSGTVVATRQGWRRVEDLAVRDQVLTLDHGLQPIVAIQRNSYWTTGQAASPAAIPLHVPGGALGNETALYLMPDQKILLEHASDANRDDPYRVMKADVLDGVNGISRMAARTRLEVTRLNFGREALVYVDGAVLAYCAGSEEPTTTAKAQPDPLQTLRETQTLRRMVRHLQMPVPA